MKKNITAALLSLTLLLVNSVSAVAKSTTADYTGRQAIIIVAASGVGKDTVTFELLKSEDKLSKLVSHTTRGIRSNEKEGVDYHFITKKKYNQMLKKGEFAEYADVYGNSYGLAKQQITDLLDKGQDLITNVAEDGAIQLRSFFKGIGVEPTVIYLLPPSIAEIERRLHKRGTETQEVIDKRMSLLGKHIPSYKIADYVIVASEIATTKANIDALYKTARIKHYNKNQLSKDIESIEKEVAELELKMQNAA